MKDTLFRGCFSHPEVAEQFLKAWLPREFVEKADWGTMEVRKVSGINDALAERREDLVYRLRWAEREMHCYLLLEHQSQPDAYMSLRIIEYVAMIWQEDRRQSETGRLRLLPLVVPIVLFPGPGKWGRAKRLKELIDVPVDLAGWADAFLPDAGFITVELAGVPWERLAEGSLARSILAALAGERTGPMRFEAIRRIITDFFSDEHQELAAQLSAMLWTFLLSASELQREEVAAIVNDSIPPGQREQFMSTAEMLKEEGRKEGQSEGRIEALQEAVLDLLETRFMTLPADLRQKVARIESVDRLRTLLREAYSCPDPGSFAAGL